MELKKKFYFSFTYFKKEKSKQFEEYEDNMTKLGEFNTGEEFFNIYEHM